MLSFLNKKVSTPLSIIILLVISYLVGWLIFDQYTKVLETRYETIELEAFRRK